MIYLEPAAYALAIILMVAFIVIAFVKLIEKRQRQQQRKSGESHDLLEVTIEVSNLKHEVKKLKKKLRKKAY